MTVPLVCIICVLILTVFVIYTVLELNEYKTKYEKLKENYHKDYNNNIQSLVINSQLLYISLLALCAKDGDNVLLKRVEELILKSGVSEDIYKDPNKYADFIKKLQENKIIAKYDVENQMYIFEKNTGEE